VAYKNLVLGDVSFSSGVRYNWRVDDVGRIDRYALRAILGSGAVDVRDVDVTTLAFGPGEAVPALDLTHPFIYEQSIRDVNQDGEDDLVLVFFYGDTELPLGQGEACLSGEIAGQSFEACDTVLVFLPGCGLGFELAFLLPPLMWLRGRRRRRLA